MAYRGFRIGALEGLTIAGSKFVTTSRRKTWEGELTSKVTNASRLLGTRPFENAKQGTIAAAFKRVTKRLVESGDIRHEYSVDDLRRFFAVREFRKDYSIERVSRQLNLSSVYRDGFSLFRKRRDFSGCPVAGIDLVVGTKTRAMSSCRLSTGSRMIVQSSRAM
jgi:hypothetical protein